MGNDTKFLINEQYSKRMFWMSPLVILLSASFFFGCAPQSSKNNFELVAEDLSSLTEFEMRYREGASLCTLDKKTKSLNSLTEERLAKQTSVHSNLDHQDIDINCILDDDLSLLDANLRQLQVMKQDLKSLASSDLKKQIEASLESELDKMKNLIELIKNGEIYLESIWNLETRSSLGCTWRDSQNIASLECPLPSNESDRREIQQRREEFLLLRRSEIEHRFYQNATTSEIIHFQLGRPQQEIVTHFFQKIEGFDLETQEKELESRFYHLGIRIKFPLQAEPRQKFIEGLAKFLEFESTMSLSNIIIHEIQLNSLDETTYSEYEVLNGKLHTRLLISSSEIARLGQAILEHGLNREIYDRVDADLQNITQDIPLSGLDSILFERISFSSAFSHHLTEESLRRFRLLVSVRDELKKFYDTHQIPLKIYFYRSPLSAESIKIQLQEGVLAVHIEERTFALEANSFRSELTNGFSLYTNNPSETLFNSFSLENASLVDEDFFQTSHLLEVSDVTPNENSPPGLW